MIDRITAETQTRLSYLIIAGYFALKLLQGFGLIADTGADLKEVLMAVVLFWFMRSRPTEKLNA